MKILQSVIVVAVGFAALSAANRADAQIGYYRVTSGYSLPSVPYYAYRPAVAPVTALSPVVVSSPVISQPIVTPTVVAQPVISQPIVVSRPVYTGPVVIRRGLFRRPVVVSGYVPPAGVVYPTVGAGVGVSTYYAAAPAVVAPAIYLP